MNAKRWWHYPFLYFSAVVGGVGIGTAIAAHQTEKLHRAALDGWDKSSERYGEILRTQRQLINEAVGQANDVQKRTDECIEKLEGNNKRVEELATSIRERAKRTASKLDLLEERAVLGMCLDLHQALAALLPRNEQGNVDCASVEEVRGPFINMKEACTKAGTEIEKPKPEREIIAFARKGEVKRALDFARKVESKCGKLDRSRPRHGKTSG